MSKKSKTKKLKYEALKSDEQLDIVESLTKTAILLDTLALRAIRNDDAILMLEVADRWLRISDMFAAPDEPDGKEHVDLTEGGQYGFGPQGEEVKDDDGSDDESGSEAICDSKSR
jgi:hypothetical protein